MAHAMETPADNPTLASHPLLEFRKGSYRWIVATRDGQSTYSVTDGAKTLSLPIVWSFGTGEQTWVFEQKGTFYESTVSFYPGTGGLDITLGHGNDPQSLQEAMGSKLDPVDARACFGCHTTDAVHGEQLSLNTVRPGVTCAHCHAGALQHAEDALADNFSTDPVHLADLSSESLSRFCGQCHRTWATVVRNGWHGRVNVRFEPYRLENSRCFNGTDPRISCIACHDPHRNLVRNETFYDSKCLACHASDARPVSGEKARQCPVSGSHCVQCHMPQVNVPGAHRSFTDHQIRIVRAGEPFPN